ncbi:hypothetical protein [Dolichospermum circinale]|uniref:hypothetical protein n=1 Tax=Dolichospermum circinale TaxID=109265 RepID=UPI000425F665|nr:hypothetical protein [Dolichospermum circinale]MDB9476119.1 hypothetical protein [Dolichospermum circinale CS-537/11]MDB9480507.1 hypothetical protein [Dolichospermum circinale CS-537/03]MDB9483554.1 hypothetical protein [Dolichospermum circinale CS-537/05]MDB9491641.1 hypothetical protein [Dolichospermum circinale CS-534/05]
MSSTKSLNQSSVPKITKTTKAVVANESQSPPLLLFASGGMVLALIAVIVYSKILLQQSEKKLNFEKFRTRELDKKLKLALETIRKLENNPDLADSRHFNLDYLRMRMSEDVFHLALINQMKIKIKDKISPALRPSQSSQGSVGVASSNGKQIDETFDIEYETGVAPKIVKRVLFRVQIRLIKLPIQATSTTVSQIIDCIETYLSSRENDDTWQPNIHGRIVYMHWDQKAKPTPLLVLEQLNEGVNVTFKTTRKAPVATRY